MNKKAYKINVENLVYAPVISDGPEGTEYGDIKKLSEAMQIQLTPNVATGQLYGDGVVQSSTSKLTSITAVVDVTKVPIDVKADILGHKYENGKLVTSGKDLPPYVAVGYRVPQDVDGIAELVWLLKGKAQPFATTVTQATDNINYSTDSLTIDFIQRESDGALKVEADMANSEFVEGTEKTWFDSVPTGLVSNGEIES